MPTLWYFPIPVEDWNYFQTGALLNASLCTPDLWVFWCSYCESTALVISSLCKAPISPLSSSPAFSEPLAFQVPFSFCCTYHVVGFSCLEPFSYLFLDSACLYSVTAFLPRKPLCTKESEVHPMRPARVFTWRHQAWVRTWVKDAYRWPVHFSPYRPELIGGRASAFCRMISVASGGTKLCNLRMNTYFNR